jgi:uncharacterized membrane protein
VQQPTEGAGSAQHRHQGAQLADPIARNISDISELENSELESLSAAQRGLEAASRTIARPAYMLGIVLFVAVWVAFNLLAARLGVRPFDPPPFPWLEDLLTLTALLATTVVLIGQARLSKLAAQRAHLDLQINLLTEQKVTTLIHLLEELRANLTGAGTRMDPHLSQLKKPTDPTQLAAALKRREAGAGDSPEQTRSAGD